MPFLRHTENTPIPHLLITHTTPSAMFDLTYSAHMCSQVRSYTGMHKKTLLNRQLAQKLWELIVRELHCVIIRIHVVHY